MSLAQWLENVFCPVRSGERRRMEQVLAATARDLGVTRLQEAGDLAKVVAEVSRDLRSKPQQDVRSPRAGSV